MSGKDLVEEIDLTRPVARWRVVTRRNQEYLPWSDLIYYSSSAPSSAGPIVPIAMGSLHETGEVPSDLVTAAVAAEREEEDTLVPSEAVPTSAAEEGDLDKEVEAELLRELDMNLKSLESELDTRLGESLEKLKDLVPEKRGNDESRQEFETRVKSWLADMEVRHPPLLDYARTLSEGLIDGSGRKDGYLESFAMAKEKRKRIARTKKDAEAEVPQTGALRNFDVGLLLVAHQKESTAFYRGITKILYDLKALVTSPANTMGEFGAKIESVIGDIGNITTSCNSMVVRSGSAIEQLNLQLKDICWHLSPNSVDARCLSEQDKKSRSIWRESTREIMLTSRFKLRDIGKELEKLVERMDQQLGASGAMHGLLEQSVQIQTETRDLMKSLLENPKAMMEASKKPDVDMEAKKKAAQQKAAEAEASKKRKELADALEVADIAAKKARALEEEMKIPPGPPATPPPALPAGPMIPPQMPMPMPVPMPQMTMPHPQMGGTPCTPMNPYGMPGLPGNPYPNQELDTVNHDGRQIRVKYSPVTGCWELVRFLWSLRWCGESGWTVIGHVF